MLTIFLTLFISISHAAERTSPFEKGVKSKNVKVTCTGEINDVFIFSIYLIESNQAHEFLVMKGLDPETCTTLRGKVKRILKINKRVIVSGFEGSYNEKDKTIVHQWKLVKGKNSCVSWFEGDCKN
jgi:hypothetical protein